MLRPMSTIDRIYIYISSYDLCLLQTVYICRFEGKLRPMSTKEVYLSRLEGTLRPISAIDSIYI